MTPSFTFLNLLGTKNLRRATNTVSTGPDGELLIQRDEKHWTSLVPSIGFRWDIFH